MTRHIVMWNFKPELTGSEKEQNAQRMTQMLEELTNLIDGIVELKVYNRPIASSNRDIALSCLFADKKALAAYIDHPEHQRVAAFVRSITRDRACMDYEE